MNATDRILPGWPTYIFSTLIPPLGILAGISAMSRDMVGPGLAMWAVSFLGFWVVWPFLIWPTIIIAAS